MAVAPVANDVSQLGDRARQVLRAAVPAAVAFAATVLLLTVGALLAGPAMLRDHANGAALALLGMGIPVHWAALAGRVTGSIRLTDYPTLFIASAVVGCATVGLGWFAARRSPHATWLKVSAISAAWFTAFCGVAALAISHGQPLTLSGFTVHVALSIPFTLAMSATWALLGTSVGALLARRVRAPKAESPLSPWFVRAPGVAMVATAVTIMGLSACGTGAQVAAATRPATGNTADPATTTSTIAPPTTVASAAAVTASSGPTTHATTARAARKTATSAASATGSGGTTTAAAASGFAPATPGVYHYNTSGSTSSLLGNKTFASVSTLTVDPPNGTRQHSTRQLLSSNGDGFMIEQILDYQPQGVALVQQRLTLIQSGKKTVKTLNAGAATLVIPLSQALGAHGVLDLSGAGIAGHEVVDLVQAVTSTVGGQSVSGVLVRSVLTVTGSVSGSIQLDQWWAASARVPMKEHLTGTMKSGFVTVKTTYDATLQSLTP